MRHKKSCIEYTLERDVDLMSAYRNVLQAGNYANCYDLMKSVVCMPAKRFWVSEERAFCVYYSIRKDPNFLSSFGPTKKEMFAEIYNRMEMLHREQPQLNIRELAFKVVNQPAPKFYITAGTASVIIHYFKKRCREKMRQKQLR